MSDDADTAKSSGTGLTFPQIAAGALAAATASILGSFLGVLGTIGGAAAASMITTVGSALYQSSLERTRDKVKERLVVSPTGHQVAGAVARVTGQGAPGRRAPGPPNAARPRPGVPGPTGAPGPAGPGAAGPGPRPSGPPGRAPDGRPENRPLTPRPAVPGAAMPRRGPDGSPLPADRQLRAGGRTVATNMLAEGAPTRVTPLGPGAIPDARATGTPPGGIRPTQRFAGPPGPPPGTPNGPQGPIGPGGDDAVTQVSPLGPSPSTPWWRLKLSRRQWIAMIGVTVSVFVIGLLASFGVETAAGRPLSGGTGGTSVGSVFGQRTGEATTSSAPEPSEPTGSDSETATSSADPSGQQGDQGDQGSQNDRGGSSSGSRSSSPSTSKGSSGSERGDGGNGLLPRVGVGGLTNG